MKLFEVLPSKPKRMDALLFASDFRERSRDYRSVILHSFILSCGNPVFYEVGGLAEPRPPRRAATPVK